MRCTGVDTLDASIDKTVAWLKGIADGFGTNDRRLAYRACRAWLHCLRDRLTVEVAAHFTAQLPELLRGVFYDGWNPTHMPQRYGRDDYIARFARDARIHEADVPQAVAVVAAVVRQHMSAGAYEQALGLLPGDLRQLLGTPVSALPGDRPR